MPDAAARLALARDELIADGFATRTAAFSSPAIGDDVARLAAQEGVDLLLMDAGDEPLGGAAATVLERAPCDVALCAAGLGPAGDGPVVVPFGASAARLGGARARRLARARHGGPLRLVGAADRRRKGRDASRLLADASLIVQRTAGIVAEPVLAQPRAAGVWRRRPQGAGALIVGLSERWREEGLGRARSELAEPAARADGLRAPRSASRRPGAGGDAHPLQLVAGGHRRVAGVYPRLPSVTSAATGSAATVCLEPAAQGGHEKEADMRRTHLITTAALVAACAVPAHGGRARGQDLQSPDTRDAAASAKVDYSMNAARPRDCAPDGGASRPTQVAQDLRSPGRA